MIKKIMFMFLLLLTSAPLASEAQSLTITDETINETITRNHFLLFPMEESMIDLHKVRSLVERFDKEVYRAPVNAALNDKGEIISAKPGIGLDKENFLEQLYAFFYGKESAVVTIPKKEIYPKVDNELLAEISTNEIGSFATYFTESNKERSYNIFLAAKAVNNRVVFPGETFSFNKVVGERTKERGYKRAPVIVKGELAEDIGGGICQVSSTLFNAVNLKGIQIVERYSHSRRVPYVPPGKDATVSWWGPDFVFKNEYNYPILIRAASNNGKMIIRIFSSEAVEVKKQ
ncbi:VanW family protein [Pseudobacillus wudalianchiensis]|uniref:Peptidoglycan binding domain-containing protein n=1 Tax=Pseudobacillus wudalianchiensis TaxID=1743143 RepID=A0A1B9B8E0_9BACI|nr:VanW family protein [Bacillus wudalianchiensis]OCA92351.1 hypothetical protein A8F95_01135 [Bacillus wudalianchiensis]